MTDEVKPAQQRNPTPSGGSAPASGPTNIKKESSGGGQNGRGNNNNNNNNNSKRNKSTSRSVSQSDNPSAGRPGGGRPPSRTGNGNSNRRPSTNHSNADSGSEAAPKKTNNSGPDNRKNEIQRSKSGGGAGGRNTSNRKPSIAGQGARSNSAPGNNNKDQAAAPVTNVPSAPAASADGALSTLQKAIADLKVAAPSNQLPAANQSLQASMHAPQMQQQQQSQSNLPLNAPIFQPGAGSFSNAATVHRKASSLGSNALSNNFGSFAPHLGAMMEVVEDGAVSFEEGEIQEHIYHQPGHQPRSQSQSYMPPRLAALAAQDQNDGIGPTGRPQLAPGFHFGTSSNRGRSASARLGPPINEDDYGFQFPQQQQQSYSQDNMGREQSHRKSESVEIGGIMAEQVCLSVINTLYRLFMILDVVDCHSKPD
jgi:protein SSD1